MSRAYLRPIRRFVLLVDDQPEAIEGGIVVRHGHGCDHHDFLVARVGDLENVDFGPGDRIILDDPNCGRRLMVDGVVYRLVRVANVIAVM